MLFENILATVKSSKLDTVSQVSGVSTVVEIKEVSDEEVSLYKGEIGASDSF